MRPILAALIMLAFVAPAGAQEIHVVNHGVPPTQLHAVEVAARAQANGAFRRAWHTPKVTFGSAGWTILIEPDPFTTPGGLPKRGGGRHIWPPPNAVVFTEPLVRGSQHVGWRTVFSHELLEMLVNPSTHRMMRGRVVEVCDPVEFTVRMAAGIPLSDYVLPSWFLGDRGPWDASRVLHSPAQRS